MSYGIYIGRNLTADGLPYLGGYGDEPSSHWLELVPAADHAPGATIEVGVTGAADLPGRRGPIPQAPRTARHLRVSYSYYKGTPSPLTNGGLNEHGVAVRDIWSPSRPELTAMTPIDQQGPNYSDLARIALERATSAREAVKIVARVMADHGHTTYGGNSHIFADDREAWVMIQFAGGRGLWAAERLGGDDIRASRPGYIREIPVDRPDHPDFLYSDNLVSVAQELGWHRPGTPFDVNAIFGDGKGRWDGVAWIEDEMRARARRPEKITIHDVMWAVRTERLTGDTSGYGQVVPLLSTDQPALRHIWHTPVGPVVAPFVPVFLGVTRIPEEFRQHRYLTADEASRFLDTGRMNSNGAVSAVPQGIESTRSAAYVYKRLLNLVFQHIDSHLPPLRELLLATEARLVPAAADAARTAAILIAAGEDELAAKGLTYFSSTELLRTLAMAETLADGFELRTRLLHGFNDSPTPAAPPHIW